MRTFRFARRTIAGLTVLVVTFSVYWSYKINFNTTRTPRAKPMVNHRNYEESMQRTLEDEESELRQQVHLESKEDQRTTKMTEQLITTQPPSFTTSVELLKRLYRIEAELGGSQFVPRVLIRGSQDVIKLELPVYQSLLEQSSYQLNSDPNSDWSVLLCLILSGDSDAKCLSKKGFSELKNHQKVSHFPGLNKVLLKQDGFCYTMLATKHIAVLHSDPLSLPCYVLPSQAKKFSEDLRDSVENDSCWMIRGIKPEYSHHGWTFLSNTKELNRDREAVIQVVSHNAVSVSSLPVVVKMYVLVTSISPLRLYRHQQGRALVMTKNKGIKDSWTLERFGQFLRNHHSQSDIDETWMRVDKLIVKTLMVTESTIINYLASSVARNKQSFGCRNCFQLLEFHMIFNASLYPFVVEVKGTDDGTTPQSVANDTLHLVLGRASVTNQVNDMLEQFKDSIGIKGPDCGKYHKVCLNKNELQYIVESEREAFNLRNYKRLYPTHDGRRYAALVLELQPSNSGVTDYGGETEHRGTPHLHSTLTVLERYRLQKLGSAESVQQHIDVRKGYWETDDEDDPEKANIEESKDTAKYPKCDSDPSTDPVLVDLNIEPRGQLKPAFDSSTEDYQITFPFDVIAVKVWGRTSTCESEARVNSRMGTAKPANYSLGVGWNNFAIHIVDLSQDKPQVLTTYKVHIYRQRRSERETPFNRNLPHVACTQIQDCDLKVFPEQACGLQNTRERNWGDFLKNHAELPFCKNGHASGRWVLPCGRCSNPESCHWREAVWAPNNCQHKTLSKDETKTCLANKKILFVGDSTNRGIMYYLMEKMNGSLRQWEKTHSMKIYSGELNDDRTSVSFAYYPQFWLPLKKKPVFVKALYHLIARFMPLQNNTNTILVVGGVQWVLPSHVAAIQHALSSLGLNGIKVVIKSLGSGFHLPVEGFVRLDQEGQQAVAQRNALVVNAATSAGYETVDTYNMTIARYKEFLNGKCGCHFHKVVNMRSVVREEDEVPSPLLDGAVRDQDNLPRYHVMGPINGVYSEVLISRMCS